MWDTKLLLNSYFSIVIMNQPLQSKFLINKNGKRKNSIYYPKLDSNLQR